MITFLTGQGDDYIKGCLIDYFYFKEYYQMIEIDLSNRKKLDADSKAINQFYWKSRCECNKF